MKYTVVCDLKGIELGEPGMPVRLHAMPNNKTLKHPRYGKLVFNDERIKRFADNENNRVRGIQTALDYDHSPEDNGSTRASGWVEQAEAHQDGLFLHVEFTPAAREAIKAKEYRYFSPTYMKEWEHPETGEKYKDVLIGGALTNRPFLKDLTPYELGELSDEFVGVALMEPPQEGPKVAALSAKMLERLGLSETASEEEIEAAIAKLQETPPASEVLEIIEEPKLDDNPIIKKLQEDNARLMLTLREQQVSAFVDKLAEIAKGTLPVPLREKATKFLMDATDAQRALLQELFGELLTTGVVPLSTVGTQAPNDDSNGDVVSSMEKKIDAILKENPGMSYGDAAVKASEDVDYTDYRNNAFIEGSVK
jgi:hypothetical protein